MSRISDDLRAQVRDRAGGRCEYCFKPEIVSAYGFHADHIIPPQHGGADELDNLAWACFECNVSKGRDVSSYDFVTRQLTPLYHPRRQRWLDHFEFRQAVIVGLTDVGRVTVRILDLNHPSQLETRQSLMDIGAW